MKRSDDQGVVKRVQRIASELNNLKNRQFLGSDSVRTFRIFTPEYVEIIQSGGLYEMFSVVFTPDRNVFESGLALRMVAVRAALISGEVALFDISDDFLRQITGEDGKQVWRLRTQIADPGNTIGFKFYFFTTSEGEISIEYEE